MKRFKRDAFFERMEGQASIEARNLKEPFSRKTAVTAWLIGIAVVILALVWMAIQR